MSISEYRNSYKTAHSITRMKETMKYLSLNRFLLRRCDKERIKTNNKRYEKTVVSEAAIPPKRGISM